MAELTKDEERSEMRAFSYWAWRKEGTAIGLMSGQDAGRAAWLARAALAVEPVTYGSTDLTNGIAVGTLPLTEGDKRLLAMVLTALGPKHPAMDDLVALLFAARSHGVPAMDSADAILRELVEEAREGFVNLGPDSQFKGLKPTFKGALDRARRYVADGVLASDDTAEGIRRSRERAAGSEGDPR